jgi:hypothetical protein
MSNEKFQYITEHRYFPKLCIAISTILEKIDDKNSKCKWVVAFKAPSDNFNKKLAREAIDLNRNKPFYSGEIILNNDYSRYEIVVKILMSLAINDSQFSSSYAEFIGFQIYSHLDI